VSDVRVYGDRRAQVLALLEEAGGALILPAAPELHTGADGELRYLPDPDLYYLSGYVEPEAVLVLCPSADTPCTMFVRERDAERERWTGPRGGVEAAAAEFGVDAAHPLAELATRLPALVAGADVLFAPLQTGRPEVDAALLHTLDRARRERPRTGRGAHTVTAPRVLLAPLRMRKDEHELALLREAARITVAAFENTARMIARAEGEWQVEASVEHAFRAAGAMGSAFPSITAGGANATVLHYTSNSAPLRRGDSLLIDAGARHRMYCADITRCFPVGGTFTPGQRAVYDVVLHAQRAASDAVKPGAAAADVENAALAVLVAGMVELRLLAGAVDDIIERKEYRRYFPHRVSHWLGLDVHDVGDYVTADGASQRLEAGMVLTVEPGLYIPADADGAPSALRGIGIRLEDDVVVTAAGGEVVTAGLALAADDVERLMKEG
jgi:Xaa-Pro aminopeptidase